MATVKISGLPVASSVTNSTILPIVTSGTTYQVSIANLTTSLTTVSASGNITGGNVTTAGTVTAAYLVGVNQPRVVSIADGTSITVNADTTDIAVQVNTQSAGTLTINSPSGTPYNGQRFIIRLQSTNVQAFSWNAIFVGSVDLPLPTVCSGSSKYDYIGFIYNSTASKWQLLSKVFGF